MNGNTLILDAFWVSNKTFPTEQLSTSKAGRAFHDYYSGTARHLGWMDLVLLKDIIQKHNITHIILQNLDTLGAIAKHTKTVKVCTAYVSNRVFIHSIPQGKQLAYCEPIYQDAVFGGWEFSEDSDTIPIRAQQYMRYLLLRTHVDYITCITNKVKLTAHWNDLGHVVFDTEPNT